MSALQGLKRSGRGSGSGEYNSNPINNGAVLVTGYDLVAGSKSDNDDVIEGLLLHDMCGIKAEFSAEGEPQTPIRVKLSYSEKNKQYAESRHSVFDMCVGREGKRAQEEGSVVMIDSGRFDAKTGVLTANWVRRGTPDLDNTKLHWLMPNTMTCVTPQTSREVEGKPSYSQSRYFAWADDAVAIEGGKDAVENARTAMVTVLGNLINGDTPPPGQAAFILRAAGIDEGVASTASINGYLRWDSETSTSKSPEDSVSHFMASEDGKKFMEVLAAHSLDHTWEVIPMVVARTGLRSLPNSKIEEKKKDGKSVSDAQDYLSDAGRFRVGEGRDSIYGFAPANTILQRSIKKEQQTDASGKKVMVDVVGNWFATSSDKIDTFSRKIFKFDELITPNLPAAVRESIEAQVAARAEAATPARNNAPAAEEQAPDADAGEEKINRFGR